MKITMVLGNDFLLPYVDGRVYREARSLISVGHDVTIICWARTITNKMLNDAPDTEKYDGIRIKRVFSPISPVKSSAYKRVRQHLAAMKSIAREIENTPTDVLHCHDLNTLFVRRFLKKFNKPIVYDSHEDFINMEDEVLPGYLLWFARRMEKKMLSRYVDRAITVCEPIARSLELYGVKNTVLVMNCRSLEDYDSVPDRTVKVLRSKLQHDDECIVLYIGSLGSDRGLKDLIEAFRTPGQKKKGNGKKETGTRLVLGGTGVSEARIKKCIKGISSISWAGFVPGKQLVEYNLASDIMVVLFNPEKESQRVCLPNKLFEAMAAKKPIIVCEGTEAARIVEKEGCGVVVPYGDGKALRNAIDKLAGDKKLRLKLGKAGRSAAENRYNWKIQEQRLLELYNNITRS
jgi:glycosyltransferase involved in cell wall biosynthesis